MPYLFDAAIAADTTAAVSGTYTATAQVSGQASIADLIAAVENVGYGASPIEDLREASAKRQQNASRQARRHAIESAVSLALGVPMMLAMFFHMPQLEGGERWIWLLLGLATLGVLATAGAKAAIEAAGGSVTE